MTPSTTPTDTITFVLEPDDGHEVKFVMTEGATLKYTWFTDGPGVNYDTHADGEGIRYHGYGKGTNEDRLEGELTAAFTGSHGWFWRNRNDKAVTVTLQATVDSIPRSSGMISAIRSVCSGASSRRSAAPSSNDKSRRTLPDRRILGWGETRGPKRSFANTPGLHTRYPHASGMAHTQGDQPGRPVATKLERDRQCHVAFVSFGRFLERNRKGL